MKRFAFFTLLAFALACPVAAQQVDEDVEVAEGQVQSQMIIASDDGTGEMPRVAIMSSGSDGVSEFVWGDASMMPAPDIFALAQNGGVQKEIELVDEQLDQLKEINEDFSKRIQDQMKAIRDNKGNFDVNRARELSEMIKKLNEEKNTRMQDVFLPHQFDRLKQISLQTQMKRSGETSMLSNQEVIDALGLTKKQQDRLKEKARELKTEMEKKIQKMKEEAREELFDELTRDQREKLKSILGNDFELKTTSMQERMQRIRRNRKSDGDK